MADLVYDLARQSFMNGGFDLTTDTVKIMLVRTGAGHYVVNGATDQFVTAIASGDRIAISAQLTSVSTTAGVFDAANTLWAAVAAGAACGAFVVFKDTGTPSTSPLIAYVDSYSGLPVTPNGSDINVSFPTDPNKILKL